MLKGIKWSIVIIVMSVSLILLFAGWFLYQENNIKEPIINNVNKVNGVTVDEIIVNTKVIELNLSLQHIEDLQVTYKEILNVIEPHVNNRELKININSNPSDEIIDAWNSSYFYIAEAIKQNKYSLVPETIDNLKQDYSLDYANCTMDEKNIYINLQKSNSSFYIAIPIADNMEVNSVG